MSSTHLNTEYHLQVFDDDVDEDNDSKPIPWSWLDKHIMYNPMYALHKPSGTERNKICVLCCIAITIMIGLLFVALFAYNISQNMDIIGTNVLVLTAVMLVSRSFGLYYFYFEFKYPWNHHRALTQIKYVFYSKLTFILLVCSAILWLLETVFLIMSLNNAIFAASFIFSQFIMFYFFIYPSVLTLTVHIAICVMYYNHISSLNDVMQQSNNNINIKWDNILKKYKSLHRSFEKSYSLSFKSAVQTDLFAKAMEIWISTYWIFQNNLFYQTAHYVSVIIVIFMYCISATLLTEKYVALETELWKYGEQCLREQEDTSYYNYLLNFVRKYPISISIGSITVTKKSIVKAVCAFIVTRYIAYSVTYFQ